MVHPKLARKIATHITEQVWLDDPRTYEQVQPGVFTDGESALVVAGAAQVSEPGITALRVMGGVWEMAVLMRAREEPLIYGPRHLYDDPEWSGVLSRLVALTSDVQATLSIFEVVPVRDEQEAANMGAVSAVVASVMPSEVEPDPALLIELMTQVDLAMEEAA